MMMTRSFKHEKDIENHINGKKKQQEKTKKNNILLKEVPIEVAMALNDIEEENLQETCKKYHLID